jgi:hypothetical protein
MLRSFPGSCVITQTPSTAGADDELFYATMPVLATAFSICSSTGQHSMQRGTFSTLAATACFSSISLSVHGSLQYD